MAGTISVPAPSSIRTGGTLRFRHIFALPILLVAFACSTEPAEETGTMTETEDTAVATEIEDAAATESADAALRQLTADYAERYDAGDAAGVAALYAEDGILVGSRGEPVEGRAAIEADVNETMQAMSTLETEVTETQPMGNAAVARGAYTLAGGENGAEASGYWLASYEKGADGEWLIDWLLVNEATSATETRTAE